MAYSEVSDLLVGDLLVSAAFDKQSFVQTAAEEMDAKLGYVYELPLHLASEDTDPIPEDAWTRLPKHQMLLLKGINNRLASGRLILALDIAGEGTTLHGYGWQLIKEAAAELMLLANGEVFLDAERAQYSGQDVVRAPTIGQQDEVSLVLGFEENVMRRHLYPWPRTHSQPGKAAKGYWP